MRTANCCQQNRALYIHSSHQMQALRSLPRLEIFKHSAQKITVILSKYSHSKKSCGTLLNFIRNFVQLSS